MKMKNGQIATIAILCLVGLCVIAAGTGLWLLGTYNGLVNIDEEVASKWGSVQTAYQRRFDLIPNLVETVKGAANFEKETFTQIAAARSGLNNAKTPTEIDKANSEMNSVLSKLMVVVEAYPELKANQNFLSLQDQLEGTENRIKWERDNYNTAVKAYRVKVRSFPTTLIAGILGFDANKYETFGASVEAQNSPKVAF